MHVREPLASPRKLHLILQACTAGPRVTIRSLICTKTVEGYGWKKKKSRPNNKKPSNQTPKLGYFSLPSGRLVRKHPSSCIHTNICAQTMHGHNPQPAYPSFCTYHSYRWEPGCMATASQGGGRTASAPPSLLIPRHEA